MADGAKLGQQAITIPDGGTSSRPGTPASGMVRLNTDLFTAEIYQDTIFQFKNTLFCLKFTLKQI